MDTEQTIYLTIRGNDINRTAKYVPMRHCRKVRANRGRKPTSAGVCDKSKDSITPKAMLVRCYRKVLANSGKKPTPVTGHMQSPIRVSVVDLARGGESTM